MNSVLTMAVNDSPITSVKTTQPLIALYCGSRAGNNPIYREKAIEGEFKHEVRQFQKPYDNQQAEQISLMV